MAGISRISVDQQFAELGVKVTRGEMQIVTPRPKMTITSEAPEMQIESKAPSFKVNWKKINSEIGLKAPPELARNFRNAGRQGALRGTKVAVEDGNFLGDLKRPGPRVPELARTKAMEEVTKIRQSNVGLMPENKAEVEWDKGYIRVNWSKHSIVIDCEGDYMPQVEIDPPYSIEVFLRTKPYFKIVVEEGESPMRTGQRIDKTV